MARCVAQSISRTLNADRGTSRDVLVAGVGVIRRCRTSELLKRQIGDRVRFASKPTGDRSRETTQGQRLTGRDMERLARDVDATFDAQLERLSDVIWMHMMHSLKTEVPEGSSLPRREQAVPTH